MSGSPSLKDADRNFVWHPYTQMKDWEKQDNRVIVNGEGFYLVDDRGRRYLDGTASMWCNVWGHGQNEVVEAMREQLKHLQHSTLFGLASEPSARLAERLVKMAGGMDRVFYTDNGSTAIEAALKMALQYWQNRGKSEKKLFVSLEGGYHGDTVGAMSVGYIEQFFGAYKPLLAKVSRVPSPLLYGSKFDSEQDLVEHCIEQTEKTLKKLDGKCAGLVMESGAQIAGGVVVYPQKYQQKISELCEKYDTLLILDEIATGFGRLGNMIEYRAQKSKPDIVCMGKALTAGYFPLAVTLAHEKIYDAFLGSYEKNKHFYHGHTFTGHPVGCAAALANLELYEKRNLMQQIKENTQYIKQRLREFEEIGIVADVRHKGMLAGIELARNGRPLVHLKNKERINYFVARESLEMGVHLRALGNIMVVIPPLAIGRNDLKKMMDAHQELVKKAEKL
ncbi:adenosylmethionine-8-amino-7-oxononanoate transaminase [Candidatus Nitrososphaera evergladensis SR1]|jgi:adenosylmethionine-8-amino-7-oxononanoate aminotransferase|uniref:Adenosylmethionine-8-amino-7-oxononanoate aminotransferase n=1 Tax=Candidatus Nitrososphaera evergladensis SR1 TaxID=1459636 RepID=A0A075MRZ2_9ARCH|nr:adenosylmethionine--8-amino-7-oxononanoate transaminase [Candidatus Nitrososphaera evergladensis]AIF83870.1 adenosylmethionine-8-amino-7-oxononanoate transaminase [Candidatus Nitrososphaera evergladensis SR1]